jgi:hypothetical protein
MGAPPVVLAVALRFPIGPAWRRASPARAVDTHLTDLLVVPPVYRRRYLGLVAATSTVGLAGCGAFETTAPNGPRPDVGEHVQGDISLAETRRVLQFDNEGIIRVVLANEGIEATVDTTLYWVPTVEPSIDPNEATAEALEDAGYRPQDTTRTTVPAGRTATLSFPKDPDGPVAGYYVRYRNLTYGAVVSNKGTAGEVRCSLVDTTDLANQRTVATRTLDLAAGTERTVRFQTTARFETFRVDATALDAGGSS